MRKGDICHRKSHLVQVAPDFEQPAYVWSDCKAKSENRPTSRCQCIWPVGGEKAPGHDETRCVLFLGNGTLMTTPFSGAGCEHAVGSRGAHPATPLEKQEEHNLWLTIARRQAVMRRPFIGESAG
jgi:hypothetical protein